MTPMRPPTSEESPTPKRIDFLSRLPAPLSAEELAKRQQRLEEAERRHDMNERAKRWRSFIAERGKRYETCRLETFITTADRQVDVKTALKRYARNVSEHITAGEGILLHGPKGTGKDHLLVATSFEAIKAGHCVTWKNGMDLFGDVRDRMDTDETERAFVGSLVRAQVLYLSDPLPPAGSLSDFQKAILFRIIDGRYNQMRPTWITVNVSDRQELESRMGPQTVDRIIDGVLAHFCNWPSHRKKLGVGFPKIAREAH